MIHLESISIRKFRGIQELDLTFNKKTFAIQGPNGSGKSGVVDAIEFALTGSINRISGTGTKGVSITEHGPHVDFRNKAHEGRVTLSVEIDATGKSATIERSLDRPNISTVTPDDTETLAVFERLAKHPEFVLSRREIIKYILVTPGERAQQIQRLLKLERVQEMRAALQKASGSRARALQAATSSRKTARDALGRALSLGVLSRPAVLAEVNRLRQAVGLDPIGELTATTQVDAGARDDHPKSGTPKPLASKTVALNDLKSLRGLFEGMPHSDVLADISTFSTKLEELQGDPTLVNAIAEQQLLELGLKFFGGNACPVCDTAWAESDFRAVVDAKLAKVGRGKVLKTDIEKTASTLTTRAQAIERHLKALAAAATTLKSTDEARRLSSLAASLIALRANLTTVVRVSQLERGALFPLSTTGTELIEDLATIEKALEALPDESGHAGKKAILVTAQTRLDDVKTADRAFQKAEKLATRAKLAIDTYDTTVQTLLHRLYQDIETQFANYYRLVNSDDEGGFSAELTQLTGSVDLKVDFYGRGRFPPVAYHSEGHQDGMGLCLYLALMQQVLGKSFTFAVLDDVVMSVDANHRREVCRLLQTHFPETQFLITTHDETWLGHMQHAGLVTSKTSRRFHGWTVDHGPQVVDAKLDWDRVADSLAQNRVTDAASQLRHYLESVSYDLALRLGAEVRIRKDGAYDAGQLFPKVVARWSRLLDKARKAAQSWDDGDAVRAVDQRRSDFTDANKQFQVERWVINPGVHYNEWANFTQQEFQVVVDAFDALLACLRCRTCGTWIEPDPQYLEPKSLHCVCDEIRWKLNKKPKP